MSSHHHHHQQSIQHCHNANSQCCCCSSSSSSCLSCSSSSSPSLDQQQLLQALASQLLLLHSPPPPPPPPPPPKVHLHRQYQHKSSRPHLYHAPQAQAQTEAHAVLHSLFQRVAALESYLPHLSAASVAAADPPSPRTPPPRPQAPVASPPPRPPHPSLREVAARTIQAQFRLFLVRRSQTLRHLQHLASIKSRAAALRSSLSDRPPAAASQEATDLLLQLDSIQSRDPMIREGKRSIGRELNRIVVFIDKVSLRDHQTVLEAIELAENGGHRRRAKPSSTKRVSFAQDVNGRRAFRGIGDYSRVLEDPEEMHHLSEEEEEEEEEESLRENGVRLGIKKRYEGQNGNLGLSAPVPVHMESRES